MAELPPFYSPPAGAEALARRLKALMVANVPARCPVYIGLGEPGEFSARHAESTYSIATHLAAGTTGQLPHFNTRPPPILRIIGAASWGRPDAMGRKMSGFPDDLASELWWALERRLRDPAGLNLLERRYACDLMLRLGYPQAAATIIGMDSVDAKTHRFNPETAMEELSVLYRLPHDPALLEAGILAAARDERFSPRIRIVLASFVVVRNGRRRQDTPEAREAAELALAAMESLDLDSFTACLARQTVYRAVAFVPFLDGDRTRTLETLDQGLDQQMEAKDLIRNDLQELAWIDHAFPLYETMARTHLVLGEPDAACDAAAELIELSPNDQRAWDTWGHALLVAGRIEDAKDAYSQALQLGGLPVARAAYYLGWIEMRLGNPEESKKFYQLSFKVDPTVPGVAELAEGESA